MELSETGVHYCQSNLAVKVFTDMLGHIAFYCTQNDLPPLTDLVVKKDTGLPGDGLATQVADFNAARERVYQYNWYSIFPPTVEEFSDAFQS